ncbi:polysaccharide deacetylase family protein [Actinomadura parmotrematis]|uniref:Polysaccharide deacetylase family protein n=1 Tax=Actinomadura parmotrematis TaxID=2864039 RepID=A0ABS7FMW8_9ACTN|nr:polysaccharide deacetylase family protein [Actinomadura parmotrematis]MBW8481104.1 polysaccharide deacetylase family protein [Actinomadura parmotrematis]
MPVLHKIAVIAVLCAVALGVLLPGAHRPDRGVRAARAAESAARAEGRPATVPQAAPASTPPSSAPPAPPTVSPSGTPGASATPVPAAAPAAAAAGADELGEVPVLMYHRILPKAELSLDRSTAELRKELERLAREGYVPITAAEFAAGRIDVPAGRHPVVLTFDDSTPGHFGLDARGNVLPDTAVGIIEDVARRHPGFRPTATFYLNDDLFGLGPRAAEGLKWLTAHGFEIANHTVHHPDLSTLGEDGVRKEIADMEDRIVALTGQHTATFAYPFGAVPRKRAWAQREDGRYSFQGVFLAGWKPSESPFDERFDRWAITRVRSEGKIKENDCRTMCSTAYLDELAKHPGERYTSDGDPATVTVPKKELGRLAPAYRAAARTY